MFNEIKQTIKEFNPSMKQLRAFGMVLGVIGIGLYVLHKPLVIFLTLAFAAVALAAIAPRVYLPMTKMLMALTFPIGWVFSRTLLALFFFGVLTPVGLIKHAFGGGRAWNIDEKANSYWRSVEQNERHDSTGLL